MFFFIFNKKNMVIIKSNFSCVAGYGLPILYLDYAQIDHAVIFCDRHENW